MVLLSAQGMDVPATAKVAFTSEDRAAGACPAGLACWVAAAAGNPLYQVQAPLSGFTRP